jgi:nitrite reductase/ring-hydroxylating ferredoxin subunit
MFSNEFPRRNQDFATDEAQGHTVLDTPGGSSTNEQRLTRRKFCNRLLITSTGLVLAAKSLKGAPGEPGSALAYPPMKIEGAEKVLPGSFLYFSYPTTKNPAVLVRGLDGEYFAHSRKCAHRGCSVDYDAARRCLNCPCHQGAYDARTGYVLYGPPPWPLDPIILQMRAGEVWAVGRTIARGDAGA